MVSQLSITTGSHRNQNVLLLQFHYNTSITNWIKSNLQHCKWSASKKCWYCLDNKYNRTQLNLELPVVGKAVLEKIHPINHPALQALIQELKIKAYSEKTIRVYSLEFAQLLYLLKHICVNTLNPERIKSYILYCVEQKEISENQLHSRLNAIKFYFEKVLHQDKFLISIPRPKKPLLLPKVISQKEILKLFEVTTNLKHRLMLKLCYGMGLRVSEIVQLQLQHINSHRMQVLVAQSKGKKDRYVPLPQSTLVELRLYYQQYKPQKFLFEGPYQQAYAIRSVQAVFKNAMDKAHIHMKIGIHGLRHSYATHLLEMGTDISYIQKLLGHNDVKTTLLYAKVGQKNIAQIVSPLDRIHPL
jgi:integrase/recombinase XerD